MTAHCSGCASQSTGSLMKHGLKPGKWDYVVALAGNPNTGKSTLFNQLTGLRQHTGNWPGKTVARAEGSYSYKEKRFKVVDLPGTYSLLSASQDEEVARDFILFGRPDVTVIVVDATRLERNLNLVLQILQITDKVVVALNLTDEAASHGLTIDSRGLARDLGVPVVPMVARSGEGTERLLLDIYDVVTGAVVCRPYHLKYGVPGLKPALTKLVGMLGAHFPTLPNAPWIALRLLEGDKRMIEAVSKEELKNI